MSENVSRIGSYAFAGLGNVKAVYIKSGSGNIQIGEHAFEGCVNLKTMDFSRVKTIGANAFAGSGIAIENLPSSLTEIGECAFMGCNGLSFVEIPSSVTTIDEAAFYECISLEVVNFKGTPNYISDSTFEGCDSLETINVPWAEEAVEGAPWGAGNATINYNHA